MHPCGHMAGNVALDSPLYIPPWCCQTHGRSSPAPLSIQGSPVSSKHPLSLRPSTGHTRKSSFRGVGGQRGNARARQSLSVLSHPTALHSGLRTRCLGSGNLSPGSSPGKQAQQKCGSWLTVVPYLPLPAWQVSCSQCWDLLCTLPRHFPGYASSLRRRHCSAQTFQAHCTPALTHSGRKAWKSHRKSRLHGILHTHRPALLSSVGV